MNKEQSNNDMTNNQSLNPNQTIQQTLVNKPVKKRKYWLIPVFIFLAMIIAILINITLNSYNIKNTMSSVLSTVYILCGASLIPSIIVAILLSRKNK